MPNRSTSQAQRRSTQEAQHAGATLGSFSFRLGYQLLFLLFNFN